MSKDSWQKISLKRIYRRREETNRSDLPLLSVYRDFGVVERAGRDDNNNKPGEDLNAYRVVYPGDLVLNKMKTWQGSLGVSSYHGIVSPAYFVCRQIGAGNPRFFHHLLRSRHMIEKYAAYSKGIRPSQWDLPWDDFASFEVSLPSSNDQLVIADYLDRETARIDSLITKKQQLLILLHEYFKAQLAIYISDIEGESAHLSHIARVFSGTGFPLHEQGLETEEIPFFKVGDLALSVDGVFLDRAQNSVSPSTARALGCRLAPPGSVLFPKVGAALLGNQRRIVLNSSAFDNNLMAVHSDVLDSRYLRFALTQFDFKELVNPGPVPSINENVVGSLSIKIPTKDKQIALVDELDNEMQKLRLITDRLVASIALASNRREALITAAVTGDLTIPKVEV